MQVVGMSVMLVGLPSRPQPVPQITSNSLTGSFEYMKEKFAHSPTKDMSEEMLVLFSNLMRVRELCFYGISVSCVQEPITFHTTLHCSPLFQAQVQELLWEKQQLLGLKDDIMAVIDYAHRTKAVSETLLSCVVLIDPSPDRLTPPPDRLTPPS